MADERNFEIDRTRRQYTAEQDFRGQVRMDTMNDLQVISSASDLPSLSGGERSLSDQTPYLFDDFVMADGTLRMGTNTPILGWHGSVSGYINTGSGAAVKCDGEPFFCDSMYLHSPGNAVLDLTADSSTEMLVTDTTLSDAAGLGESSSLGTIDGFRVPSFKGCNFEDFQAGLTFTGNPDKVFFSESPFRTVDDSNVTILTFDASFTTDVVDITDCYVKGVQSDTVVIDVDASATINEIFQYRGNTHDSTVTQSNILTGAASTGAVGYNVNGSYPLPASGVDGSLDLDSATTVTGSGASQTEIGGTWTFSNAERTSKVNGSQIQYDGKRTEKEVIHANASISGANTEFSLSIAVNDSVISRSTSTAFNSNASTPADVSALATVKLNTNDRVSLYIENVGGTGDLDADSASLTV
jgi:hypothetical protein